MDSQRFQKTLDRINHFGFSKEKGLNRLAFSQAQEEAKDYFITLLKKEQLTVRKDAFGNIIARRKGRYDDLPAVGVGSHLDTVYNAGFFDGTAGVIGAYEIIRTLNEEKVETDHPLELIVFECEESARFNVATLGSKVMTGQVSYKELVSLKDKEGILLKDAMAEYGYSLEESLINPRKKNELKAFFEIHIEQGPVLENEKLAIGVVSGIAAPTRLKLEVIGQAAHSGTTPFSLRKDAFMAAAEIALHLETLAKNEKDHGTVATIGRCEIPNGAMNVVPGQADLYVDIRSISFTSKEKVTQQLLLAIKEIERKRQVNIVITMLSDEQPISLNPTLMQFLEEACKTEGYSYKVMPSGAGHDSMHMAKLYPTAMVFVPSKEGISHNPKEYTSPKEMTKGLIVLKKAILQAANKETQISASL